VSLPHALLGLLADEPASGYDLLKKFDTTLAMVWPATQSQIYTELNRLAAAGQIEVIAEGPRGRKEYALTDAGLAELRRWLTETEPRMDYRLEPLLRVFFLGVVTNEQAVAYLGRLEAAAAKQAGQLAAIDAGADWDDGTMLATYGRLALEWGLRFSAARREWAHWAAGQIEAASQAGSAGQARSAGEAGASGA
jgi:PadR family transcriptional regulator, regulatory protein AphA